MRRRYLLTAEELIAEQLIRDDNASAALADALTIVGATARYLAATEHADPRNPNLINDLAYLARALEALGHTLDYELAPPRGYDPYANLELAPERD